MDRWGDLFTYSSYWIPWGFLVASSNLDGISVTKEGVKMDGKRNKVERN